MKNLNTLILNKFIRKLYSNIYKHSKRNGLHCIFDLAAYLRFSLFLMDMQKVYSEEKLMYDIQLGYSLFQKK